MVASSYFDLDREAATALIEADAVLPDELPERPSPSPSRSSTLLLTGATGFLGIHVLQQVLKNGSPFGRVICLIRRRRGQTLTECLRENCNENNLAWSPFGKALGTGILELLPAQITQPYCGLRDSEFECLAARVHVICHCAAMENFVAPYPAVKRVNCQSLLEMVRLATTTALKPLHYVSSCSVRVTADPRYRGANDIGFYNGYSQSKLICERIVANLRRRFEIPSIMYDLGYLVSRERELYDLTDSFECFLHLMMKFKLAPAMDTVFDYTPVEDVAGYMTRAMGMHLPEGPDGFMDLHLYNPQQLTWDRIVEYLKEIEPGLAVIPLDDFVPRFHRLLTPYPKQHRIHYMRSLVTPEFERQFNLLFTKVPRIDLDASPVTDEEFIRILGFLH